MKYVLFLSLSVVFITSKSLSQCDTLNNRIMMIGDSWSNFPVGFGSFEKNLDRFGFTNIGMVSNTTDLSVNGAVTSDFLTTAGKAAVQAALLANPSVEVVNLSIGGNDMLDSWTNSMDSLATDSLLDATMARVDSIIDFLHSVNPSLSIFIPGYDFANFGEVIPTYSFPTLHFFYTRWDGMGMPDFIELNTLLTNASAKFTELANRNNKVTYNNALGLMQFLHGQVTPLGVLPSGTYPPNSVPFPGGRLDYPTPRIRMNDYVVFQDCFHLSSEGYDEFYTYHFESYYLDFLRGNVDRTFASEGNGKDGGVTSSAIISGGNIAVGNNTPLGNSKGIISFNTASLASSASVHRADIFLHRNNQSGTLPAFSKVVLEVKNGNFGSTQLVEFSDYSSPADAVDSACVYGTVSENGYWLRISVPTSLLPYLSTSGTTQFRVAMQDSTSGNMFFFSTGDSIHHPFLDVEYANPLSRKEITKELSPVLFPNPASQDNIWVSNSQDFLGVIHAIDLTGRIIPLDYNKGQIDVSQLVKGAYFISFTSGNQRKTVKFIKL